VTSPKSFAASLFLAFALGGLVQAQPQKQPPAPPLLECGSHPGIEIICGTRSPEDLELTPDGKYLLLGQFVRNSPDAAMVLLDLAQKTYSRITPTSEPRKDWGDASCPGPVAALAPHGISLSKRKGGAWQVYVVNHGGRESIEMFELKANGGSWGLVWHGCVISTQGYNDVAIFPDGGFVATHPTALVPAGGNATNMPGQPSGYVGRWIPGKGEEELPNTRAGYPNGVLVSADGKSMYFNAWTAKEVHKYDLAQHKEVGMVKLDFMPDNLTWTKKHEMLAAGVKGNRGECPEGSGTPCVQAFGVSRINPATMAATKVYDSPPKGSPVSGVSSALEVGDSMYIGAFSGDRVVKIKLP
jgi:hypothetical protein